MIIDLEESITSVLPDDRQRTSVFIPLWIRDYAEKWSEVGAAAVVLFGSRSCGLALPDSDWDVFALFDGKSKLPPYDAVRLSTSVSRCHEVHTERAPITNLRLGLVREIARGVVLQGNLNALIGQRFADDTDSIDSDDMRIHLEYVYTSILRCIRTVNLNWQHSREREPGREISLTHIRDAMSEHLSAQAAKHIVKALCCALVLPYARCHRVSELVREIPTDWRKNVMSLKLTPGAKPQVWKREVTWETSNDTLNRIEHSLELAKNIVESGYFAPTLSDEEAIQDKIYIMVGSTNLDIEDSDNESRCEALFQRTLAQIARLKELALVQERENTYQSKP